MKERCNNLYKNYYIKIIINIKFLYILIFFKNNFNSLNFLNKK